MATLCFVVTRSPYTEPHFDTFVSLANAALDGGHAVKAFLFLDGVYAAGPDQKGPSPRQKLEALAGRGVDVVASRDCAERRGVAAGTRVGGLDELAGMCEAADRVVTL